MAIFETMKEALTQFTDCHDWHRFLHDEDCLDPGTEEENEDNDLEPYRPDDSLCQCDGPYRISLVKKAMAKEVSPEFDDFDYEPILQWADAKVVKNKLPPKMKKGKLAYLDNCYSLVWKHGVIGFDIEDEQKSRKAAALFIYLWTRGIGAAFAERCATAYVLSYKIERL